MKLSLIVLSEGKARGQAIPITLQQFLIGRDKECQLRPASQMISKRHCAVLIKAGKAFVRDFGSTNGTYVNDEAVKGERELKNEDMLKVGPLLFRVALEVTPPVNKPTPPPAKSTPTDDDDVAAMLLSLQDENASASPPPAADSDGVPSGTTVHMISPLAGEQTPAAEGDSKPAEGDSKPAEKKEPPKKKEGGNTAAAAGAILEKYMRRTRG